MREQPSPRRLPAQKYAEMSTPRHVTQHTVDLHRNKEYTRARIASPLGDGVMCNRALGVIQKINAEIERISQMANAAPGEEEGEEEGEVGETPETDEERIEREAANIRA